MRAPSCSTLPTAVLPSFTPPVPSPPTNRQLSNLSPFVPGPDIVLVLAGNKADLERNRQVPQEEAESYASSIGATLFSTSAKANKGVEPAFTAIAKSARALCRQIARGRCLHRVRRTRAR